MSHGGPFARVRAAAGVLAAALVVVSPRAESRDDADRANDAAARFDYLLHCSGCHRPDGAGLSPDVPSLRGPVGRLVGTSEGREYIARVPEVAQSPLDDDDLARLLNWVLQEFNADTLPEGFRPMEGAEVGAARARILTDPIRARAAIAGGYRGNPTRERRLADLLQRDPN